MKSVKVDYLDSGLRLESFCKYLSQSRESHI